MKKILTIALLLGGHLGAVAQKTDKVHYFLPDGKEIAANQLDSLKKVWGNRGFLMSHNEKHPDQIHLSPITDDYLKQMEDEKAGLKKLLNTPAPDFSITDLSGKRWTLSALKGEIVVLNFWFTTCPGCIQEMPEINKLRESYSGSDVVFLALTFNDAATIKKFLKNHQFVYSILPNAQSVSNAYHVNTYPTSIVIDPKGVIRFQQVGGENIEQKISAAIKQLTVNN